MTTLADSIRKTAVLKWTQELCRCLEAQYRNYSLQSAMDNQEMSGISDSYLQERINKIENNEECIVFSISSGKKYFKIIQNDYRNGKYESAGVHAFVDKNTGEVYKPASWRAPAKHVRFDMRDQNQREYMYAHCDWAGGYLYMR
tara:strand:- start:525 stop:956 length:432 start_codon:yes stop_codon:yes gene_type:complete